MCKNFSAGVLLVLTLTFTACVNKEDEPPMNPTTSAPTKATPAATPEPEIAYGQGFFEAERDGANAWRWMTEQGVIRLKNTGKEMKLHLTGAAPVTQLKASPTFKVTFNGEPLEEFAAKAEVDKSYVIPAAKQGSGVASELKISVSQYFVPKQFDPKSNDERHLSFQLRQLTWEAK